MQKGNIGVTTDNIFPIIKKFLYSDHEIFLRELVSNAVDATQKLATLAGVGEFNGDLGELRVEVKVDKEAGTIIISDRGIGMTSEEIDKYINQIAFSGAEEFLEKYKDDANAIIGHFGLGFYSSFMVAKQVDIITLSHKEGAQAVKWSCLGDPHYTMEDIEKAERGTDVVLHIDDENKEFLEDSKVSELLNKYCKFLAIPIAFGTKKEFKDGKEVDTLEPNIINDPTPAWTKKPSDLTEEDYNNFYRQLYPMSEDPLFHIHLNVDYPFNLTGVLYFPKIKENIDFNKNKIQLYSNQVFVTDSVEGVVPEFLTLLHGVIDSPDIPLNVSRSYLQSDGNVKKISSHITKKVADRLFDLYKENRSEYEEKWDHLKLFVAYGMLSDEKFYDRAHKFALLKDTNGKYFTFEEYQELVKGEQTDKNGDLIYLYSNDSTAQHSFIETAENKGYNVLLMDGQLDAHLINMLEQKFEKTRFVRVDSDVVGKLIVKDATIEAKLDASLTAIVQGVFEAETPQVDKTNFIVTTEALDEHEAPILITQNEFMRRMKDMSAVGGGNMNFYGEMPDSYSLVVNTNHEKIGTIASTIGEQILDEYNTLDKQKETLQQEQSTISAKKEEERTQEEKDRLEQLEKEIGDVRNNIKTLFAKSAEDNPLIKQLVDLGLLANNMLKGKDLTTFVKRSISLL